MADETKTNATPEAPGGPPPPAPEQTGQAVIPGMDGGPAPSGKVIDLSDVRAEAGKTGPEAPPEQGAAGSVTEYTKQEWERPLEEIEAERKKPRRGRPPKADRAAPKAGEKKPGRGRAPKAKAAPSGKTDKTPGKGKRAAPGKGAPPAPAKEEAPPPEPAQPRDATRAEKEEIVYLNLSDLHPFKDHPFGVRDDAEMQGLVESVRSGGVNQPALVRPREDGGYEIIAGHRRQRASELAGFMNMPCIVRSMTDDEAVLAMTDDNLRHREKLLPSEKAAALQQQYEAIKHQGARGDDDEAGKLSLQSVGQRNGMSVKTVQRYLWLNDLVPELKEVMDAGKLSFTPAVEISRIRPKHQKYIAVSIEGQQSSPSQGQAKRLRELDKDNKLNPDAIDAILSEEKKKEDISVIISGAELEKYFGKEATPRQMKDQIMALLDGWKEKQPPELGKGDKKVEMEK
ncbi:ParB/RepB/Spo0J family partition protein [Subdoligranulum sp. AF14-43]|nr:ParB/RepB/Spo0J family partition protein [Subdoligranulum sp. AF14-43]